MRWRSNSKVRWSADSPSVLPCWSVRRRATPPAEGSAATTPGSAGSAASPGRPLQQQTKTMTTSGGPIKRATKVCVLTCTVQMGRRRHLRLADVRVLHPGVRRFRSHRQVGASVYAHRQCRFWRAYRTFAVALLKLNNGNGCNWFDVVADEVYVSMNFHDGFLVYCNLRICEFD